ncbi:MAG: acyl-CoA dehydrogenase C-terminal domain-containing protein [Steroidobacteraceae bacterium]
MSYQAPLRDLRFVLHEVLHYTQHCRRMGRADVTGDVVDSVLGECARYAEEVVAPLNAPADAEGVRLEQGGVVTPRGFVEAQRQYREAGWGSLGWSREYGGQDLPRSLAFAASDLLSTACMAFRTYSILTEGAILAIEAHASRELREAWLPRLVSAEWLATMCLTEPQAGTDLSLLRTRAEPAADGSYRITGGKIFITAGDHDLAGNIVHLVLARLPDAPPGTRGISLFLVPKFLPDAAGGPGERNAVLCTRLEHKMGQHGSATCAMQFDGARGYMIGEPHGGLRCMFTMMNHARLAVGMQGLGQAERAWQLALAYARERRQGRAPDHAAGEPASLLIEHADVRRMLLTQKAFIEGGRLLAYFAAIELDTARCHPDAAERQRADDLLAVLTPLLKAFLTEGAIESTSHAIQVFGGHGYVRDAGVEQCYRDVRVTAIYEGTNAVQAFDLLGRRMLGSGGRLARLLGGLVGGFCTHHAGYEELAEFVPRLAGLLKEWTDVTERLGGRAAQDPVEMEAAAVDYLQFTGYLCLAWCWAKMAAVAIVRLKQQPADAGFYEAKLATARFYFARILPRAEAHVDALAGGAAPLLALPADRFRF